jgi:hypothetical protein
LIDLTFSSGKFTRLPLRTDRVAERTRKNRSLHDQAVAREHRKRALCLKMKALAKQKQAMRRNLVWEIVA